MRPLLILMMTALFSMVSAPSSAWATTFMPQPFPDKVEDAVSIVRGTAGNSSSDWGIGRDGVRRLYTFTEISPKEVIKQGSGEPIPSGTITVRELGGTKDGVGMEVSGTAHFNRGEDVVLMLGGRQSDGSFELRGMMMGKFSIERDSQGREVLTGPGLNDSGVDDFDAHGHSPGQNATAWTLDRLRQLVREQSGSTPTDSGAKGDPAQKSMASGLAAPSASGSGGSGGLGAPALQPPTSEPGSEGSSPDKGGSGGQALVWGLGLIAVLGGFGLWMALRSRG